MPNNTYTGASGASWETGGHWSLGHKPTATETIIIADLETSGPAAPVGDESALAIQAAATGSTPLDASAHLTILGAITLSTFAHLKVKTQTGAAAAITLTDNAQLICPGDLNGPVTAAAACIIGAAQFLGNVSAASLTCFDPGSSNVIAAALTVPTDPINSFSNIAWLKTASLTTTGTDLTLLTAAADTAMGPGTVVAGGDLIIYHPVGADSNFNMGSAMISCGGSCVIVPDLTGSEILITLTGTTITGPGTAGSVYKAWGTNGDPDSVTGFEPLYKVGSGAVQSSLGSSGVLILPAADKVLTGEVYGDPSHPVDGAAPASGGPGGGRMGIGL